MYDFPMDFHRNEHFHERLMERFGEICTEDEYVDLCDGILEYRYKPVFLSESGNISFHKWSIKGDIYVLFCWKNECPVTVYRRDWFVKGRNGMLIPRRVKEMRSKKSKIIRNANKAQTWYKKTFGKEKREILRHVNE